MQKRVVFSLITITMLMSSLTSGSAYKLNLEFMGLDGNVYNFNIFEGKFLMVDAMASWCGPCLKSFPHLSEVYRQKQSVMNLLSLSVSPQTDDRDTLLNLQNTYDIVWNMGIDNNLDFLDTFNVTIIPTYFLFDEAGSLVRTIMPTEAQTANQFLAILDDYLPPTNNSISANSEGTTNPLSESTIRLTVSSLLLASVLVIFFRILRKYNAIRNIE